MRTGAFICATSSLSSLEGYGEMKADMPATARQYRLHLSSKYLFLISEGFLFNESRTFTSSASIYLQDLIYRV
jgi:chorismate-pyruvate lyase